MSISVKSFLRQEWALLLMVLVPFVAALIVFPFMPEVVPTHWNAQGQVDGYSGRIFGTFFLPFLNMGLYILLFFSPKLDPKRENYAAFSSTYRLIRWLIHAFLMVIYTMTIRAALGHAVDIGLWIPAAVAVMFVILGATMSRVKFNYFVGIRVPWTLADEEVWNQTHKVASKWMMAGGLLALAGCFLFKGDLRATVFLVCIMVPMLAATIYSYILFQRKRRKL